MARRGSTRTIGAAFVTAVIAFTVGTAMATPPVGSFVPEIIGAGSMSTALGIAQQPGLQTVVARVTLGPDSSSGWHTHPGKTVVVVQSGELTVYHARGCTSRIYGPGDEFVELPTTVHIARNEGTVPVVLGVVFFGVRPGAGPLIDQPQPAGCDVH